MNLRGCFKINNIGLSAIASSCPNLEILNLHSCWDISSPGLVAIAEGCPKLRSIDLSNCRKIDAVGLTALLDNAALEEIILSYCKSINNDLYKDPFLFSNLKKLNLQRCTTITDIGYRYLDGHILDVEYLILSDCSFLTDTSIDILSKCCPTLKTLSVSFVCGLTEKSVDFIVNLKSLQTLDVSFCGNLLTDASLNLLGKTIELKRLGMRGCFKVSQNSMLEFLSYNSSIEHLNISQCKNLSLESLKREYNHIHYLATESVIDFDPLSTFLCGTQYPVGTRQRTRTI